MEKYKLSEADLGRIATDVLAGLMSRLDVSVFSVNQIPPSGRVIRTELSPNSKYPIDQLKPGEAFEIPLTNVKQNALRSAIRKAEERTGLKYAMHVLRANDGEFCRIHLA